MAEGEWGCGPLSLGSGEELDEVEGNREVDIHFLRISLDCSCFSSWLERGWSNRLSP